MQLIENVFLWNQKQTTISPLHCSNTRKQLIGGGGAVKGLRDRPFARVVSSEYIWSPAITRNVPREQPRELSRASSAQITNTVAAAAAAATVTTKYTRILYRSFWRVVRSLLSREAAK